MRSSDPLVEELRAMLAPFDATAVISSIGALGLIPRNASHAIRLEALAAIAGSMGSGQTAKLSRARLLSFLQHGAISQLASTEDPCENMFTEEISFFGGGYIVFPGILDHGVFRVRELISSIFQDTTERLPDAFLDEAASLTASVLSLSHLVAVKARIARAVPCETDANINVPSAAELDRLRDAVVIRRDEIESAVQERGFPELNLNGLTFSIGGLNPSEALQPDTPPLARTPVLEVGDYYVIAAPGLLTTALRFHLLRLAFQHQASQMLASAYGRRIKAAAASALRDLGMMPIARLPDTSAELQWFEMDERSCCVLHVIVDPLDNFDPATLFPVWETSTISSHYSELAEGATSALEGTQYDVALHVVCADSPARRMVMHWSGPEPFLFAQVAELEVMAELEDGDPLFLHKFAQARQRARRTTEILSFDLLSEYEFYRSHHYSFYATDSERPNLITLIALGGAPYERAVKRADRHVVPAPRRGFLVDIRRRYSDSDIPIYRPVDVSTFVALYVESDCPCWVVPELTQLRDDTDGEQRESFREILESTEAIAFWLWQFSEILKKTPAPAIVVNVRMDDSDLDERIADVQSHAVEDGGLSVTLTLFPALLRVKLLERVNSAEREILDALIPSIAAALGIDLSLSRWRGLRDQIAPLGPKRMLRTFEGWSSLILDNRDLPRSRRVREADFEEINDSFQQEVAIPLNLEPGVLSRSDREHVFRRWVQALTGRLSNELNPMRMPEALCYMVANHESLIRDRILEEATLASQVACFGRHRDHVTDRAESIPVSRGSELAFRFLIEHMAARPPTGVEPPSLERRDRALAAAYLACNWGAESDYLHYGISDYAVEIYPSGRLGADRSTYMTPRDAFLQLSATLDVRRMMGAYARAMATSDGSPEFVPNDEFEAAFKDEFGCTASQLADIVGLFIEIGQEQAGSCKEATRDVIVARVAERVGEPPSWVLSTLQQFMLEPRQRFDMPPTGTPSDVWPWRLNRSYSYIRRPLISHADKIYWGNRHLVDFMRYIEEIVSSGRLRATSPKMRAYITSVVHRRTEEFNDLVADMLSQRGLEVDRRVSKIGGLHISDSQGNPLGDIDVLAFDANRKSILVIECKDFAGARTASELSNELERVFSGKGKHKSVVQKHLARTTWVNERATGVLQTYGFPSGGRWKVESLIVVDTELMSPFFVNSPIKVVPLENL